MKAQQRTEEPSRSVIHNGSEGDDHEERLLVTEIPTRERRSGEESNRHVIHSGSEVDHPEKAHLVPEIQTREIATREERSAEPDISDHGYDEYGTCKH